MKNNSTERYCVYPGEFVSSYNEDVIIERRLNTPDNDLSMPFANVKEMIDQYKVEVAVPGVEKDKLIVFAKNNLLLICSSDEVKAVHSNKTFQRHIHLPEDADTELTVAEYRHNVLSCYVPKTRYKVSTNATRIIVY